ncbi:MAG: molybdenum cofactor biosynthesis protein MoaE [Dehalococcoidia bacterium]|nr:molybdenum cofactor biosynthesis protein MoaE [Dehalococcoidia bacterium]
MELRVRLFAVLRDAAGASEVSVEVPVGIDARGLIRELESQHPELADRCEGSLVAVNEEYAEPDATIKLGDTIALIPPVSGGAISERASVGVTEDALDALRIANSLRQPANGALVTFEGIVRDNNLGRRVLFLEYEAYRDMAVRVLKRIADQLTEDHELGDIAIWHRIGHLEIGDTSLVIAVGSPHRLEAFKACSEAVDQVKALVPVWKREVWEGGAEWLGRGS